MHGPKRWAGGVGALEGIRTPSLVAKAVMEQTDNHLDVGAVGSTGRGESNLYAQSAAFVIDRMRAGRSPKDAGVEALRRVRSITSDKRLINGRGTPRFGLAFYILSKAGTVAAVAFYAGAKCVVRDEDGTRTVSADALFPGQPFD